METMQAVRFHSYGGSEVLVLEEVPRPEAGAGEVLIRVRAAGVNPLDWKVRIGHVKAWMQHRLPLIPGWDVSGVVEAVGPGVTDFKTGDAVYGSTGMRFGANAEYICLPAEPGEMEGGLAVKPANMTFEQAATVPFGARDALHFLRLGQLQAGQKILINGAGGSIGTFAVQLAKLDGAQVAAVDSGEKLEMLRSLGADEVIDYTQQDFTQMDVTYDVIFDVVGTLRFTRSNRALKKGGIYLLANPIKQLPGAWWTGLFGGRKVKMQSASGGRAELDFLRELIEAGKLRTVIDREYPLEAIVEAHRYVETGAKQGNVVITIA
ncbi:MAG: NAD(P)-dependent alcohol dehydrogenase [Anaerolineales bacterium]